MPKAHRWVTNATPRSVAARGLEKDLSPTDRKKQKPEAKLKTRSRAGCWPCKARKIKCGEEKPSCTHCVRADQTCDYSIRLNWGGRANKSSADSPVVTDDIWGNGSPLLSNENSTSTAFNDNIALRSETFTSMDCGHVIPADDKVISHGSQVPSGFEIAISQSRAVSAYGNKAPGDRDAVLPRSQGLRNGEQEPKVSSGNTTNLPSSSRTSSINFSPVQHLPMPPESSHEDAQASKVYGYDRGIRDFDIPYNRDMEAIAPATVETSRMSPPASHFEPHEYYSAEVVIRIPNVFEPIPKELVENPINLLYFHHFINHTGRLMVLHDCPDNVFLDVLPRMAMHSPPLMHLILIYSACHRARVLHQPEPKYRIAKWMSDILPSLREALSNPRFLKTSDPADPSLIAPLLTAIMFASLEIICPNIFPIPISWRVHLHTARELIRAKGGLNHLGRHSDGTRDRAVLLVSRWFAYLDVMGAFSGSNGPQLLLGAYDDDGGGLWLVNRENEEELYGVDCALGFSGQCLPLLARAAELAGECDEQRINSVSREINHDWSPTKEIVERAEKLIQQLYTSGNMLRGCTHSPKQTSSEEGGDSLANIYWTNQIYHWAGVLVVAKRALALPSNAPLVQQMVQRVSHYLTKQRFGISLAWCPVFPIFIAGCEAITGEDRALFDSCLNQIQTHGLHHVDLLPIMNQVYSSGQPWETIIDKQFLG